MLMHVINSTLSLASHIADVFSTWSLVSQLLDYLVAVGFDTPPSHPGGVIVQLAVCCFYDW